MMLRSPQECPHFNTNFRDPYNHPVSIILCRLTKFTKSSYIHSNVLLPLKNTNKNQSKKRKLGGREGGATKVLNTKFPAVHSQ